MLESIIIRLLPLIIQAASPEIKKSMQQVIITVKKQATETPNKVDDILVEILEAFFMEETRRK